MSSVQTLSLEDALSLMKSGELSSSVESDLKTHPHVLVRAHLAKITRDPIVLEELLRDSDSLVRAVVASRPLSPPLQLALLEDPSTQVLCMLAENPSSEPPVLEKLSFCPSPAVLHALSGVPSKRVTLRFSARWCHEYKPKLFWRKTKEHDTDLRVAEVLLESWEGSLESFFQAARTLGPQP